MGCADSKTNKKYVYATSFNTTSKNSTNQSKSYLRDYSNEKFPQNSFSQKSRLAPFYEQLEDLYKECKNDYRKFIMMIEQRVSEIYMEISQQTLANMNHQEIAAQQSKIIISEEILSLNLNVLKVIGRNINFQYDKETFKELNKFQHHLVGYLKTKYPRGQQTFVSGDLMKIFKQFDRVNDLNYDILKNSNTYFGEPQEEKIIKGIKLFVNKIIKECDKFYPQFEKLMQDRAFFVKNQKGQKTSLNYKIGRKIPENVAKYEDLETGVLQVFSPQVFRVLIKWMEDLEETIKNSSEKISKKQSFKCYIGEKPAPSNGMNPTEVKKQKELLFDYINKYEYDKIVDKLILKINALKPKLQDKNKGFVDQLDEFNQRLLKILNQADPKQRYVPTKQIETIKYSSFNAKFVEYILTEKLVYVIKELIKVGQSFIGETSLNLDVIKFRVTDLMRCQVSGNKKEILQIYNNFRRLQEEGNIEIIKIKNRLSTPLNDAMIIFVMKGSWIICQAQLVLSQSGEKIDKRSKNTELVNHYFYELERSPYGIMAEIAVLLTYKDSKVVYENKITFHESDIDIEKCKLKHRDKLTQNEEQKNPFICSKCSVFYSKSQNLFKFYKCKECKTAVCSKCILKKNPELENSFILRDINRKLQQKINQLQKSGRQKKEAMGTNSVQKISKKITPKSILNRFQVERIKLREKFDGNYKKSGPRKVQALRMMEELNRYYGINQGNTMWYFLVVNFLRGEAGFKLYSYDYQYKEIQNTSDPRQKYDESSYFSYSEYDIMFMFSIYEAFYRQSNVNQNHLFLFLSKNQLQAKMDQVKKLKAEGKINKDQQYQIVSIQLRNSTSRLVLDYTPIRDKKKDMAFDQEDYDFQNVEKKEFKYPSLKVLGDMLPALKSARTSIQFDDLGIETKHLDYFRDLSWRHSIKELMLANNKIENVTIIFDNLNSLERFYFNQNYVKELRFNKPIQNLQILNGSKNLIASIQGLNNIRQIRKLLLESNKLKQFPISKDLTVLNLLNLKENYLSNVSNILNTDFPQLQQLIISGQLVEYNQQDDGVKSQRSDENNGSYFIKFWKRQNKQGQMVIQYPKLKNFQSQDNRNLLKGKQIFFTSESLQKISLNDCSIDRIIFDRRQCIENVKYLHLSGNRIKYFSFLGANQPRNYRKLKDSTVSSDSQIDNKSISNDSLVALVLSNNQIQYLPVMKFTSLKRLELQSNKIKDIRPFQKSKLSDLQYLDLGNNPFTEISPLYLPKLNTLKLQEMKQLYKVDTIFKGPCELPSLENIFFSSSQKIDFSFDLNPKNNLLTKLKELRFQNVKLMCSKKQLTTFEVNTLEKINLMSSQFDQFPILKLPKIKNLCLQNVIASSFKNLQRSKLPELTYFSMMSVTQKILSQQVVSNLNSNGIKQQERQPNKYLTCDFNFPKLKTLTLSNFKLGSLRNLNNHSYEELESLTLKNIDTMDKKLPKIKAPNLNYIEILYIPISNIDSFLNNGFSKLSTLYLEHNEIQSISESTLASLTEIKTLSLADNKLKKFVCSKNLDKLTMLDLSGNSMKNFPRIKAKNLSDMRWFGNQFNDLSQLQNCQLPSLESIQFIQCDLSKSGFPKMNLQGLQTLTITNSKLSDLTNLTKSNLPALRELNLMNNQIAIFPNINMPQLSDLYLDQNKIKNLEFLSQSNLENLTNLTVGFNAFSKIPSDLQFSHLKLFECRNVNIGTLPLFDFPQLEEITVEYAELTDISQFAKGQYKVLKDLNFSNNKLTYLPRVQMQSLTVVVIDNNLIEDLSDFLDSDFTVTLMQWFSFQNNKIRKVPNLLFSNVRVIYLNDNPLEEFNSLTLLEYPEINGIYLNNTNLKKIRLPKLPKLEEIEMNDSKIQDLDWLASAGPNLPKLRRITMNSCQIKRVPNLDQIKGLKELNLQNNPIKNVDGIADSTLITSINFLTLDLDVGPNFEKVKDKINRKNPNAQIGVYYQKQKE